MLESLSLDGKSIIITGGGTGLGRAMVNALARAGADVAIAARRTGPIEEAADEVRSLGRRSLAIACDVADSAQVDAMVDQTIAEFGKVDVMINNAGRTNNPRIPIWEVTDEIWRSEIDMNLSGAFFCARAVAKHMADRGKGKIINVASGFGIRAGRDIYTYACGKGRNDSADPHTCLQPGSVRHHSQHHRPRFHTHAGSRVYALRAACVRGFPAHGQAGKTRGHGSNRRVPVVGRLRLHDRGDDHTGRRGHGGRHCSHWPRSHRSPIDP